MAIIKFRVSNAGAITIIIILILFLLDFVFTLHETNMDPKHGRLKVLKNTYDKTDLLFFKKFLRFPVERECIENDYVDPDVPQDATEVNSELIALWSDFLHKYLFSNEELVPSEDAKLLEKVALESPDYMRIPLFPLCIVLSFLLASFSFIIIIPIIGCILFHIGDFFWSYVISIMYKNVGRLVIIWYYKTQVRYIIQTKPTLLEHKHFRIPKYFRNDTDTEDYFEEYAASFLGWSKGKAGGPRPAVIRDDSSNSEFDIEEAYRPVLATKDEEIDERKLTDEEKKQKMKERRKLFQRAKGRRQSIQLAEEDYGSSSSDEIAKHNLSIWEYQIKENEIYKNRGKLTPGEMTQAKKSLLQELREERQKKMNEIEKDDLEKVAGPRII